MTTILTDRKTFIGGSDIAGILGISRWSTPLSVWAHKTGAIPETSQDSEATELGTYLEEYVARRFSKVTGKKVQKANERRIHPQFPHFRCQIDRLVIAEDSLLECKSTGERMGKYWEDDQVPAEYQCQVMWQLACSGRSKAYVACLIGNREFVWREIKRDPVMIAEMLKRANAFWNDFVIPKVMPGEFKAGDIEVLAELFPTAEVGKVLQLDDQAVKLAQTRTDLMADRANLDNLIKARTAEIQALLGDAEFAEAGPFKIAWRNVKKKAYSVAASEYRMFKVEKKEN